MHDAGEASAKRASSYAKFLSLEAAPPIVSIGRGQLNSEIILACIAVPLITLSWVALLLTTIALAMVMPLV
jgi:hypothetical protein